MVKKENEKNKKMARTKNTPRVMVGGAGKKSATQSRRKKTRRKRRKNNALREIKTLQRTWHLMIPKKAMARLIIEIQKKYNREQMRWQAKALECIHHAAENYLQDLFTDAQLAAIHGRRVTIQVRDFQFVRRIRGITRM